MFNWNSTYHEDIFYPHNSDEELLNILRQVPQGNKLIHLFTRHKYLQVIKILKL